MPTRLALLWLGLSLLPMMVVGETFKVQDPAPPSFISLDKQPAPTPQEFDRLKFHSAPKPLADNAMIHDWPRFLGPADNAKATETPLLKTWPEQGPTLLWEVMKGGSYTSPAIAGDFLVLFHAMDGHEIIECLHRETGKRYWRTDYAIEYRDRYGYSDGPRGSPVITRDKERVITLGVTSILTCLDLATGRIAWQRDLRKEFQVPQDFFGHGSSPLVYEDKVIINIGGKEPLASVGAFDLKTGRLIWGVLDEWGASYASPMLAVLHGQTKLLVFAGGESKPATGGLLCIDPKTGELHDRFPWRANDYISVNATSPVLIPEKNRVFVSTCYPKRHPLGGVVVEYDSQFNAKEIWKSPQFGVHWMNPIYHDGYLYGIDGETDRLAKLVCFDADTGEEKWRDSLSWQDQEMGGTLSIQRASLLLVNGKFFCLGELGSLHELELTPEGCKVLQKTQLFYAPHTWCLPALSHGLLYVMQNYAEQVRKPSGQRILCFDLRGE